MRTVFAISAALAVAAALPQASLAYQQHHAARMHGHSTRASRMSAAAYKAMFHRMAPADEYFGRFKESILEIRNRLDAFDRRSSRDMRAPGTRRALDNLQDAIRDWQRKYPQDPWLPRSLHRLHRDYQRAGLG